MLVQDEILTLICFGLDKRNVRGQRGTLRALARIYVIDAKVIFSFRKSVFRDVHINQYNLDLRILVKKQISMAYLS